MLKNTYMNKLKIAVFSAHPDDMETGLGGTLHKLALEGHEIHSYVITVATQQRRVESLLAHSVLGIKPQFMEHNDGGLYADKATIAEFEQIIETLSPDVVFSHSPIDVHPDHRAAGILTLGPVLKRGVTCEVFLYEVASTTHLQTLGFTPTHYVALGDIDLSAKRTMIESHRSQAPEKLAKVHTAMQMARGEDIDMPHAEAFIRLTRSDTLLPELQPVFQSIG